MAPLISPLDPRRKDSGDVHRFLLCVNSITNHNKKIEARLDKKGDGDSGPFKFGHVHP